MFRKKRFILPATKTNLKGKKKKRSDDTKRKIRANWTFLNHRRGIKKTETDPGLITVISFPVRRNFVIEIGKTFVDETKVYLIKSEELHEKTRDHS